MILKSHSIWFLIVFLIAKNKVMQYITKYLIATSGLLFLIVITILKYVIC